MLVLIWVGWGKLKSRWNWICFLKTGKDIRIKAVCEVGAVRSPRVHSVGAACRNGRSSCMEPARPRSYWPSLPRSMACNPPERTTCVVLGAADGACPGSSAAMHGARCRSCSSRLLPREASLPTNKFMWKFDVIKLVQIIVRTEMGNV